MINSSAASPVPLQSGIMAAEAQGLPQNPNLQYAQWKFLLSTSEHKDDKKLRNKLLQAIKDDDMAPFYEEVCHDLGWKQDDSFLLDMRSKNTKKLKELDDAVEDAETNLGETEIKDAMLTKAEYYTKIGDKENAIKQFRETKEKTISIGQKLDIVFHQIRIGLFYMDHDLIKRNIQQAESLIEEGGDWDRRNRLKVYHATYKMATRDFKGAAPLFLDTIATFTSTELMDYPTFVTYTIYTSILTLDRPALKSKVIQGSEILEVLHELKDIKKYLFSLYGCHYNEFFKMLAVVEQKMKFDRLLRPHYQFYNREMRIMAYKQLLESYRSLSLGYMAEAFGVSKRFIDSELSKYIAAGRLHCKIDKVAGIVETNRPDNKNSQYQSVIKQGDLLLNRVQKLSRVINI